MSELGIDTYRFSTSWSACGRTAEPSNPKGLDFYSRLVDELLEAGIRPWPTLYHWDMPQALEEVGGWANRDVGRPLRRLRDRPCTTRSATASTRGRPSTSRGAPRSSATSAACMPRDAWTSGRASQRRTTCCSRTVCAVGAMRAQRPEHSLRHHAQPDVGAPVDPADAGDLDAARRIDGQFNRVFLDPLFRGDYPDGRARRPGAARHPRGHPRGRPRADQRRRSTSSG